MDIIQNTFNEIRALHAELQQSEVKAQEYIAYLESIEKKAQRLQKLMESLHNIIQVPGKEDEDYFDSIEGMPSFFYTSATQENENQPIWTVTDYSYVYSEEDLAELEKAYLTHKLQNNLDDSLTSSKKTKI